MKRILTTGAAGSVRTYLRAMLRDGDRLRLSAVPPLAELAAHEEFAQADVRDAAAVEATAAGVDGMSDNARAGWNHADARRLGYRARERSADYGAGILAGTPAAHPQFLSAQVQGGDFAVVEVGGGAPRMGGDD